MTDAPKKIWANAHIGGGFWACDANEYDKGDASEYHLARPGQPCSTDEFLERLQTSDIDPCQWHESIFDWSIGEFRSALDAIEGVNA